MSGPAAWIAIVLAVAALIGFLYWLLILTEGTYLGQRTVTLGYDIAAHAYDNIKQYDPDAEALFLGRPLAEILAAVPAPLVLDIGTGTARLPLTLFEQPSFRGQIIGVDDSRRMLAEAANKLDGYRHRMTLIWQDGAHLPFHDDTFDAVTCLEMLEFTPDPAAQLAEAVRVLRPGGVLATTRRRGWNARVMPGKTHSARAFTALLAELALEAIDIQAWQVDYDLVWAWKPGASASLARHRLTVLNCPACGESTWDEAEDALICSACGAAYLQSDGIVEMQAG